jgi:hypothetical protein
LITVATPAQATQDFFALQLQGPFNSGVQTGLTPAPCSLGYRFRVYSPSSKPIRFIDLPSFTRTSDECQAILEYSHRLTEPITSHLTG